MQNIYCIFVMQFTAQMCICSNFKYATHDRALLILLPYLFSVNLYIRMVTASSTLLRVTSFLLVALHTPTALPGQHFFFFFPRCVHFLSRHSEYFSREIMIRHNTKALIGSI